MTGKFRETDTASNDGVDKTNEIGSSNNEDGVNKCEETGCTSNDNCVDKIKKNVQLKVRTKIVTLSK
jgi:hypothetical protein